MTLSALPSRAVSPSSRGQLSAVLIGRVWGALLAFIPFFDYFLRPNYQGSALYQSVNHVVPAIAVLSTIVLLAAVGFSFVAGAALGLDYNRQKATAALALALTVFAALSGMTAGAPAMPLIILTLFLALVMAVNFGALNDWEPVFEAFAATAVILFMVGDLLALTSRDVTWGRLGGHAGPNYWGMISGAALMLCLCLRPAWMRIPVILIAMLTLYLTQARGSIFGIAAGGAVLASVKLISLPARKSLFYIAIGAMVGFLLLCLSANFIAHKVLLIDDQYRGVGSNGSGRLIGWGETLKIILAHPLFGVGLRQHEQYLRAISSAHNAYLAVAAEQGFIGLFLYVLFMVGGAVRAFLRAARMPTPARIVLAGYLAFFLTIGIFEQYSIQTGNSFALIAMVAAALSWRSETWTTADTRRSQLATGAGRLEQGRRA